MIWALFCLLWSNIVWSNPADDVAHHVIQAEHFLKRGWIADAEEEYLTAYALPDGPKSTDLASVGARIAWARLDIESAMVRSQELATLSDNSVTARAARTQAESYAEDFGFIEIHGPHPGTRTFLRLTAMQPILDPRLAEYSVQLQDKLATPAMLPTRFALPVGNWEINGQLVSVEAGQEASTEVPIEGTWQRLTTAIQASRLEVASGLLFWLGPSAQQSIPGPAIDIRWIQPFGQLNLETSFSWNSGWRLNSRGQAQREAFDFGGAIAIGRHLQTPSALSIRPIVGLHLQKVGVIHLDCVPNVDSWDCKQAQQGSNAQEYVSTKGWALMPLAALAFEYNPIPGAAALASGFRLSLLHATGKSAASGSTHIQPEPASLPQTVDWQVDSQRFHGWQIRLQASIALAF